MSLKGIVLAGGAGTRLHPVTVGVSKQLLPVYDKPMIYYPLSTLDARGHPRHPAHLHARRPAALSAPARRRPAVGHRAQLCGAAAPGGPGAGLPHRAGFIGQERVALVLGDNIFYGHGLPEQVRAAAAQASGATVFAYRVRDPERYGVVEFDAQGKALSIEEKPARRARITRSPAFTSTTTTSWTIAALAATLRARGAGDHRREPGLPRARHAARGAARPGHRVARHRHARVAAARRRCSSRRIESRQGLKVCCPEEIAFRCGYIDVAQLERLARALTRKRLRGVPARDRRQDAPEHATSCRPRSPTSCSSDREVFGDPRGFFLETLAGAQVRRGRHHRQVRAGQPQPLDAATRCADCTTSCASRRESWCGSWPAASIDVAVDIRRQLAALRALGGRRR